MLELTREEKSLARHFFKTKIHESNGAAFETLFTQIMNYAEPNFMQIKPWGNIGDQKNDGYIPSKGVFYQVYAPEAPQNSYPNVVQKLNTDFNGLICQWPNVKEFYFVFNDKYHGVNPDCAKAIDALKDTHSLDKTGFVLAKNLEEILLGLSGDQIIMIVGNIPDPSKITHLDYTVLKEVVDKIMLFPAIKDTANLKVPDWNAKIQFNELTMATNNLLSSGSYHVKMLDEFINTQSRFLADELCERLREIYLEHKKTVQGDELFIKILHTICPTDTQMHQNAAIVIMAKYFETCDIFEEPPELEAEQ